MRPVPMMVLAACTPIFVLCGADAPPVKLVLCHTFGEGRGLVARDVSGRRRHAVLSDDAKWVAGRHGSAVQLADVSSTGVELGLPASWYVEHQQALTVLLGAKPSTASGQIIFGVHSSQKGRLYVAVDQGGRWAMGLGERPWGKDEKRTGDQADGEWHALAMTLDHGTATLYVDGAAYSEKPYSDIGITLPPRLGGARQFGFDGVVDEVAIFRGLLSEGEIRSAAAGVEASGLLAKYAQATTEDDRRELVAEWRFDDGPGTKVSDSSGNELHGAATACEPAMGIEGLGLLLPARSTPCWVEVPHSAKLELTDALTVSAWLHWDPRSSAYAALVDKGYTDGLAVYFTRYSQRVHVALATDQAKVNTDTGVRAPVYEWMHVALTWSAEAGRVVLYMNGKRAWFRALPGTRLAPCKASLFIGKGRRAEMGTLAGIVDEVRIYTRALSADDIAALHAPLAGLAEAKSVSRWVPAEPGLAPLERTTLDPENGTLSYPAFPIVPSVRKQPGVSAADFPSIQAAVDSLPESGGAVAIPAGVWRIAEPIVLRSNVSLVGAGASTVVVNENRSGANAIECRESTQYRPRDLHPPGAKGHHGVYIANLQIRGNAKSGHGIYLHDSDHFTIENCLTFFNGKSGVCLSYGEENDVVRGVVSKWNGQHGLYIEGCHDTLITASHFEENRLDGIHVQKDNIQAGIVGCNAEDNGRFGIYNKGRWTQVVGCESDSNEGGAFVFIGPESEYSTVVSASIGTIKAVGAHKVAITGNTGSIVLTDCHRCTITGNAGPAIRLDGACAYNTLNGNSVARVSLAAWCHHNAVSGNVCTDRLSDRGRNNAVTGNVDGR